MNLPNCDGLWIEIIEQIVEPRRHLIKHCNVYQVQGDWAILVSSSDNKAVLKSELQTGKWFHVVIEKESENVIKAIQYFAHIDD